MQEKEATPNGASGARPYSGKAVVNKIKAGKWDLYDGKCIINRVNHKIIWFEQQQTIWGLTVPSFLEADYEN